MKKYDVVVIGAGNAGLSCAITLAKNKYKVALVEKHNLVGGVASSFVRGRFEFEATLHELCGVGDKDNPGLTTLLYDDLGIDINLIKINDIYRIKGYYSDGTPMDVTLPAGVEAFKKKLLEYVPDCGEAIDRLIELGEDIMLASDESSLNGIKPKDFVKKYANFVKYGNYTVNEVFEMLDMPIRARDILAGYWSYIGVDYNDLTFMHFIIVVYNYIKFYPHIPKYTSSEIVTAKVEKFREYGGDLYLATTAEKVLYENDKIYGIKTDKGIIYADNVVSNMNPTVFYQKMIDKKYIPTKEIKLMNKREFSARPFIVYLGLNKEALELGITDYNLVLPSYIDSVKEVESMKSFETNEFMIAICPNVINDAASPKGTAILSLTTLFTSSIWNDIDPYEYNNVKEQYALKLISKYEKKMGINIKDYIEEIEISTPWTYYRYSAAPDGCAYGYAVKYWDSVLARTLKEPKSFPIKNLWFCGGHGALGNGYNVAGINGNTVAKLIMKKVGAKNEKN